MTTHGDFLAARGEEVSQRRNIVPGKHDDILNRRWQLSPTFRTPHCVNLRIAIGVVAQVATDEDAVLPAVKVPLEFDNKRAIRGSPRHTYGGSHGLGAGHEKPHSFRARDHLTEQLGKLELPKVLSAVELTVAE